MDNDYEKGLFVTNYLESIGLDVITATEAISDENLQKSYDLIRNNLTITKYEFVKQMGIDYDEEELALEEFLRRLQIMWYHIEEALDEEHYDKTLEIYKTRPDISQEEFLEIMQFTGKYKEENINKPIILTIEREGKLITKEITAEYDTFAGGYRLGLWVRDNAVGVGMMTYIDENGFYGSLGHPITDIDTGAIIPIGNGKVYKCSIIGVKKGEKGAAGELKGLFLKTSNTIGQVYKNEKQGVFGTLNQENIAAYSYKKLELARNEEVKMGQATIVTTIDGVTPKEYEIEIIKTNHTSLDGDKCMIIRIVDEKLLSQTGGIVQGMSGSPIIQTGKIVGAVTHVFVNDPKKGFANYISSMVF